MTQGIANSPDDLSGARRSTIWLTRAAFFLSGFTALVYEIVWQRVLVRLVGVTTPAIALIVCIFMGGLLIGSIIGAGLAKRAKSAREQIRLFGILELLVGVSGVLSVLFCKTSFIQSINDMLATITAGDGSVADFLRLFIAFLFIIIPTTLMGATLPVMAAFTSTFATKPSFELGRLYAFNTSGAVAGALVAGMQLLPLLGISKTLQAASSLNALSCILAMLVAYLIASQSTSPLKEATRELAESGSPPLAKEEPPAAEQMEAKKASAATPRWLADDDDAYDDVYADVGSEETASEEAEAVDAVAADSQSSTEMETTTKEAAKEEIESTVAAQTTDETAFPQSKPETSGSPDTNGKPPAPPVPGEPDLAVISWVVLVGSAFSLAMEIVWTRFLVLLFGSSTYALSAVLSVFIAGLALGAWATSILARKIEEKAPLFSLILAALAVSTAACLFQYQQMPALYLTVKKGLLDWVEPGFFYESIAMIVSASFVILPSATFMGMLFPLALDAIGHKVDKLARQPKKDTPSQSETGIFFGVVSTEHGYAMARYTSNLYALSIIGSIIGSAVAAGVLPALGQQFTSGIEMGTIIVAAGYAIFALFFCTGLSTQANAFFMQSMRNVLFFVAVAFAVVMLRPIWNMALMSSGLAYISTQDLRRFEIPDLISVLELNPSKPSSLGQKIIMYREGENSIITVGSREAANIVWLKNNGKVEAALPIYPAFPAPESDLPTQTLLGLLPAVLVNNSEPATDLSSDEPGKGNKGLVIGFGTGTTCGALLAAPWIVQVTAVELERSLWLSEQYFEWVNGKPMRTEWLNNDRLRPVTADARNYLSTSSEKFDFIVSQPAEPWVSGAADLYTKEFYQLSKTHLRDNGIFCQWLPMYSLSNEQIKTLMRTFQSVYPNVFVWHTRRAGELILTGSTKLKTINLASLSARVHDPRLVDNFELIGIEGPFDLLSDVMMSPDDVIDKLAGEPQTINTDDDLVIEFSRERELAPEEMNMSTRFISLTKRVKEEAFATTPGNAMERALALAFAARKRHEDACSTDYYYYPVLQGALLSQKVPPPLKTPYTNFLDPDSAPDNEFEDDEIDIKLTEFRYYLMMGEMKKAILAFREVPADHVKTYGGLCDVATGYFIIGDYQAALNMFQKAENLRSGTRSLSGIGLCYWLLRDDARAEKPLRDSLSRDPNQFLSRYALGQILCRSGKEDEGLKNMRAASQVNPSSPLPGIFVTAFFTRKGQWAVASDNLRLVMRRKHAMLPQALALGFLIAEKSKRLEQLKTYRERFKEITAAELSEESGENIVKEILDDPYAVRRIQINN